MRVVVSDCPAQVLRAIVVAQDFVLLPCGCDAAWRGGSGGSHNIREYLSFTAVDCGSFLMQQSLNPQSSPLVGSHWLPGGLFKS